MRLVDLHCDWLRQYATETTLYDRSLYPEVPDRVGRLDGYLLGTSLAVLVCAQARRLVQAAGRLALARVDDRAIRGRIHRENPP
jgi:hypothetical protein